MLDPLPEEKAPQQVTGARRFIYLLIGHVCVALGITGFFVPLMPSTVFFITAAWLYLRSSEKFYQWLIQNKIFGKSVRDYREKRGMSRKAKRNALLVLYITLGVTAWLVAPQWWMYLILVSVALLVTGLIYFIKTLD
jgi:hypothetical protein